MADVDTAVTGPRATGAETEDQDSRDVHRDEPTAIVGGGTAAPAAPKLGPKRCRPHGLAAGLRPDGEPRCPFCRRAARDTPEPDPDTPGPQLSTTSEPADADADAVTTLAARTPAVTNLRRAA